MHVTIRKAIDADVDSIFNILRPYAREGLILDRSHGEIRRSIANFYVAENNGKIHGVVSYYDYGERLKEVRSLAVPRESCGMDVGSALVRHLIEAVQESRPKAKVFVLTYSPGFFKKLGFSEVPRESLPEKIWKDCDHCVNRECCGETALVYGTGHEKIDR